MSDKSKLIVDKQPHVLNVIVDQEERHFTSVANPRRHMLSAVIDKTPKKLAVSISKVPHVATIVVSNIKTGIALIIKRTHIIKAVSSSMSGSLSKALSARLSKMNVRAAKSAASVSKYLSGSSTIKIHSSANTVLDRVFEIPNPNTITVSYSKATITSGSFRKLKELDPNTLASFDALTVDELDYIVI